MQKNYCIPFASRLRTYASSCVWIFVYSIFQFVQITLNLIIIEKDWYLNNYILLILLVHDYLINKNTLLFSKK